MTSLTLIIVEMVVFLVHFHLFLEIICVFFSISFFLVCKLLEILLISVADVAIVFCERTLLRLAAVLFRSDVWIELLFNGFSLFPDVDKSFGCRADRVRIWVAIKNTK